MGTINKNQMKYLIAAIAASTTSAIPLTNVKLNLNVNNSNGSQPFTDVNSVDINPTDVT